MSEILWEIPKCDREMKGVNAVRKKVSYLTWGCPTPSIWKKKKKKSHLSVKCNRAKQNKMRYACNHWCNSSEWSRKKNKLYLIEYIDKVKEI